MVSLVQRINEKQKIENIPPKELDRLLSHFYCKVRSASGSLYEPSTPTSSQRSLDRQLIAGVRYCPIQYIFYVKALNRMIQYTINIYCILLCLTILRRLANKLSCRVRVCTVSLTTLTHTRSIVSLLRPYDTSAGEAAHCVEAVGLARTRRAVTLVNIQA